MKIFTIFYLFYEEVSKFCEMSDYGDNKLLMSVIADLKKKPVRQGGPCRFELVETRALKRVKHDSNSNYETLIHQSLYIVRVTVQVHFFKGRIFGECPFNRGHS